MRATRTIEVDAPVAAMMAVLTDFERYPEFLPEIERARTLARENTAWEVSFTLSLIRRFHYTLRLLREPGASPGAERLSWSLVEGSFRANSGAWDLEPLDGGARCRATYTIDLRTGMYVPAAIINSLLTERLEQMMASFRTRAEAPPPDAAALS